MSRARIAVPWERVEESCQRHHTRRLAIFGSVLREDFTPTSDIVPKMLHPWLRGKVLRQAEELYAGA